MYLYINLWCQRDFLDLKEITLCVLKTTRYQVPTYLLITFSKAEFKAVVKYVGGFWPIGVFFAGYRSFFFVPSRQTQTKARL